MRGATDYAAREAEGAINRLMPAAHVTVRSQQRGLLLSGRVETAAEAARAASVARGFLGRNDNTYPNGMKAPAPDADFHRL